MSFVSISSGKEHVTRHASIFDVMYGLVSAARAKKITRLVIKNPKIPAITTLYFEFFELKALAEMGEIEAVQEK